MWDSLMIIFLQLLSGSMMYSYFIAKLLNIDLTKVRDGNPGAYNLWISTNWKIGILGVLLDYLKGIFPLFWFIKYRDLKDRFVITTAALAGILGHVFSPFLGGKGGKAISVSFGAWTVVTGLQGPLFLGLSMFIFNLAKWHGASPEEDALKVFYGFLCLIPFVIYKVFTGDVYILYFYLANFSIIIYTHRRELYKVLVNA